MFAHDMLLFTAGGEITAPLENNGNNKQLLESANDVMLQLKRSVFLSNCVGAYE
jgi:hypothetical protein